MYKVRSALLVMLAKKELERLLTNRTRRLMQFVLCTTQLRDRGELMVDQLAQTTTSAGTNRLEATRLASAVTLRKSSLT